VLTILEENVDDVLSNEKALSTDP